MTTYILSKSEKIFLIVTVSVVFLSVVLSLCIGLVLPPNFVNTSYSSKSLKSYCQCKTPSTEKANRSSRYQRAEYVSVFEPDIEYDAIEYNPYLVSLSIDDSFVCSGVIIAEDWILVGRDCAATDEHWLRLKVRSGSPFWAILGDMHDVVKFVYLEDKGPAILQVMPPFTFGLSTNKVRLPKGPRDWKHGVISSWFEPKWNKDSTYLMETWEKQPRKELYEQELGEIRQMITCNPESGLSGALVSDSYVLIAYRVGVCKETHVFVDLQNGPYAKLVRDLDVKSKPNKSKVSSNVTTIYCSAVGDTPSYPSRTHPTLMYNEEEDTTSLGYKTSKKQYSILLSLIILTYHPLKSL